MFFVISEYLEEDVPFEGKVNLNDLINLIADSK
jgi:hypothetical protein